MKVEEILRKKGTRIVSVRLREPVAAAARLMTTENIGALVVKDVVDTEGSTIVGMLSERDIVRALVKSGPGAMQMPVETLVSKQIVSCNPNDDLTDVIEKMDRHGIRHVPVLEEHTLVGVISVRDVIRALRGPARAPEPATAA